MTKNNLSPHCTTIYFNPHEREARDLCQAGLSRSEVHFNPHEREARDPEADGGVNGSVHFNPHEREARDRHCCALYPVAFTF